jgi:hypothetical protein
MRASGATPFNLTLSLLQLVEIQPHMSVYGREVSAPPSLSNTAILLSTISEISHRPKQSVERKRSLLAVLFDGVAAHELASDLDITPTPIIVSAGRCPIGDILRMCLAISFGLSSANSSGTTLTDFVVWALHHKPRHPLPQPKPTLRPWGQTAHAPQEVRLY